MWFITTPGPSLDPTKKRGGKKEKPGGRGGHTSWPGLGARRALRHRALRVSLEDPTKKKALEGKGVRLKARGSARARGGCVGAGRPGTRQCNAGWAAEL